MEDDLVRCCSTAPVASHRRLWNSALWSSVELHTGVVVDLLRANPWDDEARNCAGWGARLLMVPVFVFFGVATLFGCLFRGIVGLRLRAVARQPDVSDGELCQLKQANRITSVAVIASLVGLAVIGLAYVVF